MHNGNWNDGMGNGGWWWIPMMILMIAFWGGLIWIGVTLVKRNHTPQLHAPGAMALAPSSKPTAEDILADRLARGEIDTEEYRHRVDAIRTSPGK